jgi:hypothetical protein
VSALDSDDRAPRRPSLSSVFITGLVAALWLLPGLGCDSTLIFRDPRDGGILGAADAGSDIVVGGDAGQDVPADMPVDAPPDVPADTPPDVPGVDVPIDVASPPDVRPDVPRDTPPDLPRDTPTDVPRDAGGPLVCNVEGDCRLGLHCLTTTHACVECVTDNSCPHKCNTTLHRCVECSAATVDTDCQTPAAIVGEHSSMCSATTFRCMIGCDDNPETCNTSTSPPFACDSNSHLCAQCTSSANCTAAPLRLCDLTTNLCVQCLTNTDCTTSAAPICDGITGRCVQCRNAADCTTAAAPNCVPATLTCAP